MSFLDIFKKDPLKAIFKDDEREDHDDILQAAMLLSHNDADVMNNMNSALDDPIKYLKANAERLSERGIELDDEESLEKQDADELLFLSMVDELEAHGYAFEFDYNCELKDFLWGLEQINNYELIADAVKSVKQDESGDVEAWAKEINAALGEKACLCYIYIESDSYPIAISDYDTIGKPEIPFITAI